MDIKEKIEDIVKNIKKDPDIKKSFEKDPVKTIEKLLDVDLPDGVVEKIIDGVKAKMTKDNISDMADKIKKIF